MKVVFDLDGTICFKGKPLTKRIVEALKGLEEHGHEVIFASARPIRDMLPVIDDSLHHVRMIGGNGSLISKEGKLLEATAFSDAQVEELLRFINVYEATYLIDGEWDYSYTGDAAHPILQNVDPALLANMVDVHKHESIVKVLILSATNMEELAREVSKLEVVTHRHHAEDVLDISPSNIDKWTALKKLGIEEGDYVAFGNDANDITMFQHAAHSVMIGYHEQLAPYATESIPCDEHVEEKIIARLQELVQQFKHKNVMSR
ncbi:HAD-IIB family hydrolase [Metabacillus iocasae]|uniref:Cof subfamily protein (Haloacid dehalogenase superfamily) n=1 Tax=Priestia iocasae TaxID=2291674 RepID=A0ABS2QU57_9BACI|nr:Cof subfamily protein (haloacid dehalogenase superfamily) [Metabacillus iocasae]